MTIDTNKTYTPEELADALLRAMKEQLNTTDVGKKFFLDYRNNFVAELRTYFGESILDKDVDPDVMLEFFTAVCQAKETWLAFNLVYTEVEQLQWISGEFYNQVYEAVKEQTMGENGLASEGDISEEILHKYTRKYFDLFGKDGFYLSVSLVLVPMLVIHDIFKMTFFSHLNAEQALEWLNEQE